LLWIEVNCWAETVSDGFFWQVSSSE